MLDQRSVDMSVGPDHGRHTRPLLWIFGAQPQQACAGGRSARSAGRRLAGEVDVPPSEGKQLPHP